METLINPNQILGGNVNGEYNLKVIDYNGDIIDQQNLDENDVYTLPTAPTHSGLTFKEWVCTQTITDNTVTKGKNDILVGAIYTTSSGQNEFDIELTTATGLTVTLNLDGTKDWGDGTSDTNTSHTYSSVGKYTIKCNGTIMTTSSSSGLFGNSMSNINGYLINARINDSTIVRTWAFQFCQNLETLVMSVIDNTQSTFYGCYSLKCCIIPKNSSGISSSSITECYALETIVLPVSVETLDSYSLRNNYNLKNFVIPVNVNLANNSCLENTHSIKSVIVPTNLVSIPNYFFNYAYTCTKFIFLGNVTSIGNYAFYNNYNCLEYDFTNCTQVPTLSNVNAFNSINKLCKIKVPQSLYSTWITETNWLTYADYIVGV